MKELLRTTDPVLVSFLQARMDAAEVQYVVLDTHTSIMEGSLGFLPRRILVAEDDFERAQSFLQEADDPSGFADIANDDEPEDVTEVSS